MMRFIIEKECEEPFTLVEFLDDNDGQIEDEQIAQMESLPIGDTLTWDEGAGGLFTFRRVE